MGLWTPLRPTTAGSLGLFSSFWSFACTIPSLSLLFLSPIFSPTSCHFQLFTPFPLPFHSDSHCLTIPFCCLFVVFTLWVQVLSCASQCPHFPSSFLVLINLVSALPNFPWYFLFSLPCCTFFSVSFPSSFYYSLFLLFLPVLLPSFFLSHIYPVAELYAALTPQMWGFKHFLCPRISKVPIQLS